MLFDPDPRLRWLFCMTHPDDELAIAGWIRRLTKSGADVHLSWTTSNAERRWEAHDVAEAIGVPTPHRHFLPGRDREVETQLAELLPEFARLIARVEPDRIVVGAFEQGHLDHDATNLLSAIACSQSPAGPRRALLLETPLYHAYCQLVPTLNRFAVSGESDEELRLDEEEIEFKTRLATRYPSQNIWANLAFYRLLQRLRGETELAGRVERLRIHRHSDFRTPNLSEPLAARVHKASRWRRWIAALDALEREAHVSLPVTP